MINTMLGLIASGALIVLTACGQTAIECLGEWWDRRKQQKDILKEYAKWYDKYLSCDNFGGAIDKGRAAAMCVVLRNELRRLERGEENE